MILLLGELLLLTLNIFVVQRIEELLKTQNLLSNKKMLIH